MTVGPSGGSGPEPASTPSQVVVREGFGRSGVPALHFRHVAEVGNAGFVAFVACDGSTRHSSHRGCVAAVRRFNVASCSNYILPISSTFWGDQFRCFHPPSANKQRTPGPVGRAGPGGSYQLLWAGRETPGTGLDFNIIDRTAENGESTCASVCDNGASLLVAARSHDRATRIVAALFLLR
jgi:hypothetical protein